MRGARAEAPVNTVRLAVVGSPIVHSRSPQLHRAAYDELGLGSYVYERIEIGAGGLSTWARELPDEWRGLSVTMPLKVEALELADEVSDVAVLTGGANTLVFDTHAEHPRIRADNTDVAGIIGALREAGIHEIDRAEVLGAGATAASALAAIAQLGATEVRLIVRTPPRAARAVALAERLGMRASVDHLASWSPDEGVDLVASTLPAGASPQLDASRVPDASALFDVVYDPWPTSLASAWTAASRPVVPGIHMLIHQAVEQVRLFTGHSDATRWPERDRVLRAMREAIDGARPTP